MITAQIYYGGLVRKSWKFRFIGANNKKFGHQYNDRGSALEAVVKLTNPEEPVRCETVHPDGTVEDHGRLR